jgi:flagellar biosynthesis protein FliP
MKPWLKAAKILFLMFLPVFIIYTGQAIAQTVNIDMGGAGGSATRRMFQLIALLTVLSLAPSILMMVTSFTRIIVVLSLLRSALGIQQTPPNPVLISLALFLTLFIMQPVFEQAYDQGILPLIQEKITEQQAWDRTVAPFKDFMLAHVRDKDLDLFKRLAKVEKIEAPADTPLQILIPSFMISELRRAFEIGFLVFVPFLIIDMVVASTLMSMGMMMLPPVLISLPFKLIFFVLVDGWNMLSESLVKSFGVGLTPTGL